MRMGSLSPSMRGSLKHRESGWIAVGGVPPCRVRLFSMSGFVRFPTPGTSRWAEKRPLPEAFYSVAIQSIVAAEERDVLGDALRDDEAVERVLAVEGEGSQGVKVRGCDLHQFQILAENLFRYQLSERAAALESAEVYLDRHFPQARDAEDGLMLRVFEE